MLHTKYISSKGFFSIISLRELITPWGMASLGPRGLIGSIYVRDHKTLLHTKYISCRPHGFRVEDVFKFFPIISLWELMTLGAWPFRTPGAWLAGFM